MSNRKPRAEKPAADSTKLFDLPELDKDDCFGQLWDPEERDCSICAHNALCGSVYSRTVLKSKQQAMQAQHGPFLSDVRPLTDAERLTIGTKLIAALEKGKVLTTQGVVNKLMGILATKDKSLAIEELRRIVEVSGQLKVKKGLVSIKK